MIGSTNISGNIKAHGGALDNLISTLSKVGIHASSPAADELYTINSQHPAWHHYDTELALYEAIAEAPFHIIFNDGKISEDIGRQILYALAKDRPIIMTGVPKFDGDITAFTRDTILSYVPKFHSINIAGLDQAEMKELIETIPPQQYHLDESEKILIRAKVRGHFRRLLEEAREIYVEKH